MMKMITTELRGTEAMRAIFAIDAARFGKLKCTEEFYGFKNKGRALLVEPVNGSPYVIIDNTAEQTPGTISLPSVSRFEFASDPGSGTDHLRARMEAGLFLESLPDTPLPAVPSGELIIQKMRDARRGPCQMHDQASTESIEAEEAASSPSR